MPAYVVVGAAPSDLPTVASLQFAANVKDAVFGTMCQGLPHSTVVSHLTSRLEHVMDTDLNAHIVVVKDALTHDMVAYAIWHFLPPGSSRDAEIEWFEAADENPTTLRRATSPPSGRRLLQASMDKRWQVAHQTFGLGQGYAYISALGTHPDHQRNGAASKLVAWGVDKADDQGMPVYVESTPAAIQLYRNFDFEPVDTLQLDLTPGREGDGDGDGAHICMIRTLIAHR